MAVEISLKLPEVPTRNLGDLRKGCVFVRASSVHAQSPFIYMVLQNNCSTVVAVRLQDGEQQVLGSQTKVVELNVTITARLYTENDDLPF